MLSVPVFVKHQGKRYEVSLDPATDGKTFKSQLYSLSGVEPERQKVLIKGGQLKDDTSMSSLKAKAGDTFMMMGTPLETTRLVEKPREAIKFLEDMTDAEAAKREGAIPAGLQNLGNTCYMNATLQMLRFIPELQEELALYKRDSSSSIRTSDFRQFGMGDLGLSTDIVEALRNLFRKISETQEGIPPIFFLNSLRRAFPQFAQLDKDGHGYAQQDAEEAWSQIIVELREKLRVRPPSSFVDKFITGQFTSTTKCDEPAATEAGEESTTSVEDFLKLSCHINSETNHLRNGLASGMVALMIKNSPVLGRDASYTKTSRISRLPKYLPVHFMRFDWRRTTNKKAKILRRVTFPHELDVVEFCSEELQRMLIPIRDRIRDITKEEEDFKRSRLRQKRMRGEQEDADEPEQQGAAKKTTEMDSSTGEMNKLYKTDAEIEAENAATIHAAKKDLLALVNPELANFGANQTGLYELRGVITHQGMSADSGHYTSFVKKPGSSDSAIQKMEEEDGKWWWFNDEKVCEVDREKIVSLAGGGQNHSAYILLYRAVSLPTLEE